ncbi:MAG: AbrB/MazE/SpoVT family DNA-binding domain-containing protein [Clostridiales bacterium]|nr:AbrB/MazE/SpoVT family DNA-binding domain-containing protein [Clostridiales bacterium]
MMADQSKFVWTATMTSKGQIVIPKQAREVFGFKEGDTLILLGDKERGIAIAKYDDYVKFAEAIFQAKGGGDDRN